MQDFVITLHKGTVIVDVEWKNEVRTRKGGARILGLADRLLHKLRIFFYLFVNMDATEISEVCIS